MQRRTVKFPLSTFTNKLSALIAGVGLIYSAGAFGAWQTPLTAEETAVAIDLALESVEGGYESGQRFQRRQSATSAPHALGVQLLLVELKETKTPGNDRVVEVFTYDYDRGATERRLIDAGQRTLLNLQSIESQHLPLTDAEINYAKTLLQSSSAVADRVQSELQQLNATQSQARLDSVESRVSVWVPRSLSGFDCQSQRCAVFSLYTDNLDSLNVEPVVNLVSGRIYVDLPQ